MQELEMNISLPNQIVIYMQLRMGCLGSACSFAKGEKRGRRNKLSQTLNRTKIPKSLPKLKERSGIRRGLCNRGYIRRTPFCAHLPVQSHSELLLCTGSCCPSNEERKYYLLSTQERKQPKQSTSFRKKPSYAQPCALIGIVLERSDSVPCLAMTSLF